MTPFALGQAVTFPHSDHTTGGVVTSIDVDDDGVTWCTVRNLVGAEIKYRNDALYAKAPARDAARQVAAERAAAEAAIARGKLMTFRPAPPPQ